MLYRRYAILVSNVIHRISISRGTTNRQFWPQLCVSGRWLQFEFTNWFELMHKAWCSFFEVTIKFQGHTGRKFDDLDQIWARLLAWSQPSNPSDSPCLNITNWCLSLQVLQKQSKLETMNRTMRCETCGLTLNSEQQAKQHFTSKSHNKKMKSLGLPIPDKARQKLAKAAQASK